MRQLAIKFLTNHYRVRHQFLHVTTDDDATTYVMNYDNFTIYAVESTQPD